MHSEMIIRDIATKRTRLKLRVVFFVLAFTDNADLDDVTTAVLAGVAPVEENETECEEAG